MKVVKKNNCQLLQTVPTSGLLQLSLSPDAIFENFKQSANKLSQMCQSKSYIACPNSLTKAVDGLFK